MSDIKDLLDEAVGSYVPRGDRRAAEERVERRKRRRRLIAACTALGVFAVAGTLTWTAFAPGSKDRGIATSPVPIVTQTVQGVIVTHRASWTLVDLWPLARSIATWPEPVGNSISVPDDTPERGGLPVLQLSNDDLGLQSSCGDNLMGQESFLYVALNGGPFRVNPDGTPIWKSELSEADGPCGRGWYAYKTAEGGDASSDMTTSTPYLVFAGFGPNVSQGDREAVFAAFDSLEFVPFDYLRPPAQASPSYVSPGSAQRLEVYEVLIRHLVNPDGTQPIYVLTDLCFQLMRGKPRCPDDLTLEEQQALGEGLRDLGDIVFRSMDDPGPPSDEYFQQVVLGPIMEMPNGLRVEGGNVCGGLCGHGAVYVLVATENGYKVTGTDDKYGEWIA